MDNDEELILALIETAYENRRIISRTRDKAAIICLKKCIQIGYREV